MTVEEIKLAVDLGKDVYLGNLSYKVNKRNNDYFIDSTFSNHSIGLTWADNTTLNGKEKDFFIK